MGRRFYLRGVRYLPATSPVSSYEWFVDLVPYIRDIALSELSSDIHVRAEIPQDIPARAGALLLKLIENPK
jgi:hypothetical protein